MGIEKLTSSLLSESRKEAQKVVERAERDAVHALAGEKTGREKLLKEAEHEAEKLSTEHRREREAWARLEAKRMLAEAREDAMESVFEELFNSLSDLRKSDGYKKFLKSKIPLAMAELRNKDIVIHCLKGEKSLVAQNGRAKVVESLDASGGAMVETADGKIRIDLTLETLLETRRESVRKEIHSELFGEKHGHREKKKSR